MTSNTFFQRNTISNWNDIQPERQGLAKVRSKRAQSHAQLKIDASKFQHREVFDSKIYQKVNFFRLGLKDLQQNFNKQEQKSIFNELRTVLKQLCAKLNDKNVANFSKGYINYWGLVPEYDQKQNIMQAMTEMMVQMFKKISIKFQELRRAKQQADQYLMRLKVDLKLNHKQQSTISQKDTKLNDRNHERQKKLQEKLRVLDFQLKKQALKSQQLEEVLIEKGKQIHKLQQQNKAMQLQKQQQKTYRETMQFKVKRLKEELEVAHIIKQQNLADKMKYIMNW